MEQIIYSVVKVRIQSDLGMGDIVSELGEQQGVDFRNTDNIRVLEANVVEISTSKKLLNQDPYLAVELQELKDYKEYVEGKIDINEIPLDFEQYKEFNESSKEKS